VRSYFSNLQASKPYRRTGILFSVCFADFLLLFHAVFFAYITNQWQFCGGRLIEPYPPTVDVAPYKAKPRNWDKSQLAIRYVVALQSAQFILSYNCYRSYHILLVAARGLHSAGMGFDSHSIPLPCSNSHSPSQCYSFSFPSHGIF